MSEKPVQFVIAIFESEQGAEETLARLKTNKEEALDGVQAAVAMRKDAENQIHYKDVGLTPAKGAVAGVVLGAVIGIATGGAGLALGALGALVGGVVGKRKREGQIASEKVNQVVASIQPETSVLLTVVEQDAAVQFGDLLDDEGAHTFETDITADLADQLHPHGEVAHNVLLEQLQD